MMPSKSQLKKDKYFLQVEQWKKKYGLPQEQEKKIKWQDLTTIKADRICAKKGCDRTFNLHRHHKGHDYIFACILPDVYAPRYIQYHNDDCCYLCKQHHQAIHRYYAPVVDEFFKEIVGLTNKDLEYCCERYKARLTKMCENFIQVKVRNHVKSKRKSMGGRKHE